jgi:hypothetical protein
MTTTQIIQNGLLPETALLDSTTPVVSVPDNPTESAELTTLLAVPSDASNPLTPLFALGFGNPYLINNSARVDYTVDAFGNLDGADLGGSALAAAVPTNGLRKDLYMNDMRNGSWSPTAHTLLCGGGNDPTVFFSVDTETMAAFWPTGTVTVLNVDPSVAPSGPYAAIQAEFQASQAQELALLQTAAGGGLTPLAAEEELLENYHGASVPPFCTLAARTFFDTF